MLIPLLPSTNEISCTTNLGLVSKTSHNGPWYSKKLSRIAFQGMNGDRSHIIVSLASQGIVGPLTAIKCLKRLGTQKYTRLTMCLISYQVPFLKYKAGAIHIQPCRLSVRQIDGSQTRIEWDFKDCKGQYSLSESWKIIKWERDLKQVFQINAVLLISIGLSAPFTSNHIPIYDNSQLSVKSSTRSSWRLLIFSKTFTFLFKKVSKSCKKYIMPIAIWAPVSCLEMLRRSEDQKGEGELIQT